MVETWISGGPSLVMWYVKKFAVSALLFVVFSIVFLVVYLGHTMNIIKFVETKNETLPDLQSRIRLILEDPFIAIYWSFISSYTLVRRIDDPAKKRLLMLGNTLLKCTVLFFVILPLNSWSYGLSFNWFYSLSWTQSCPSSTIQLFFSCICAIANLVL